MSARTLKAIAGLEKTTPAFRRKLCEVADRLVVNPDYLAACIAFETNRTFSPSVKNAAGSGATGLIQFMPSTAKNLGTTTDALARMTAEKQLDYVEKYFAPWRGKLKTLEDLYAAILWPAAVGKPDTYVLFSEGTKAYEQNRGFDRAGTGEVTKAQVSAAIRSIYASAKGVIEVTAASSAVVALVVSTIGAGVWFYLRGRA